MLTAFEKDESDLLASLDQSLVSTILLKAGAELVKDFMQEAPDCRNDADQEDPVSLLFALASLESKNAFNTSLLRSKKDAQVAINVQNQLISMLIEKCLRQKDSAEIGPMDLLKRALAETACSVKSLQDVRFEKESMNNVQDDCWSMVLACDITFLRCGLQALEAEKDQQESGNSFPPQLCSRAAGLLKCQQLLSAKLQTILIPTCALKKCFYFILKNCYISSVSPLGYDRRLRLGGDSLV